MKPSSTSIWITALLLLLLATLLIPRLQTESLWGDEGWSVAFSDESPRQVMDDLAVDRHPPLYFMSLYFWRLAAGDSMVSVRLLALFGSLVGGACFFRLGKQTVGQTAALCSLLLFVLADDRLAYSIEVRHYTWLLACSIASTWFLFRWLQTGRGAFWYVLAVIAGIYTHTFMFMVLLVQGLYSLTILGFSRRFWRLAGLWALALLAFSPWGLVFAHQFVVRGGINHDMPMTWATGEFLLARYFGLPLAVTIGLGGIGVGSSLLQKKTPTLPKTVLYWAALAIVMPMGLTLLLPSVSNQARFLTERNLSIIVPPLLLLMGVGLATFTGLARWSAVGVVLVTALLTDYPNPHNPPWRPIARLINQYQVDDQPVIADIDGDFDALEYHLEQLGGHPFKVVATYELYDQRDQVDPLTSLRFEGIGEATGFWYVYWDNDPFYLNAVEGWGFQRMATLQDAHLGSPIYLYRYDDPTALLGQNAMRFGPALRLHQAFAAAHVAQGKNLAVSLWWSVEAPLITDYAISVFLLDGAGQLVAQQDESPPQPMSMWEAEQLYYHAPVIQLPPQLPSGEYRLGLKVYNSSQLLPPQSGGDFWEIGVIRVEA